MGIPCSYQSSMAAESCKAVVVQLLMNHSQLRFKQAPFGCAVQRCLNEERSSFGLVSLVVFARVDLSRTFLAIGRLDAESPRACRTPATWQTQISQVWVESGESGGLSLVPLPLRFTSRRFSSDEI